MSQSQPQAPQKQKSMRDKILSILDPCYKDIHWGFLGDKRYKHIWLLLFWPIFGILFWGVEHLDELHLRDDMMTSIYWQPVDDAIPFCEWFLFPYIFWFVFLVGMYVYTLLFEVECFKKLMYFTALTYGITLVIYLLFPNQQDLRPTEVLNYEGNNFLILYMKDYYAMDTNTNVFPSLHVIGSFCVQLAAWHSKRFCSVAWRIAFTVTAVLISVSTVFLKQHSILDIFGGLLVCLIFYFPVYYAPIHYTSLRQKNAKKRGDTEQVA